MKQRCDLPIDKAIKQDMESGVHPVVERLIIVLQ